MQDTTLPEIPALTADNVAARAAWARAHTKTVWQPAKTLREDRADGTIILRSGYALPEVVRNTGVWLHHCAHEAPDRIAISERTLPADADSAWRDVTYRDLLAHVRAVGSWLIAQGYGPADRIAVLSGNGMDHLLLSLGAQYVGIPVAPLAEQYALIPNAHDRLLSVLNRLKPSLIFVDDAKRYGAALMLNDIVRIPVLASLTDGAPRAVTAFRPLLDTPVHAGLDAVHAEVGPDTLAKILFTSGSSSEPKGVLTTQGMMCTNQAQMTAVLPLLARQSPRITDWLPWNHVFGGSHNVNMMLAHGGTFTIDHGKPTPAAFPLTLANRRSHPGTLAFNVPAGYAMLTEAAGLDPDTLEKLFSDLELIFYAGASLPSDVWVKLETFALMARGSLPLMISSWGLTETAPACLMVHEPIGRPGVIGVPLPALEVKLLPDDDGRCEIRVRGPNIFKGYLDDPAKTAEAFDEEGFFITGDAVRFVDPGDASRGLVFDGRVTEDFKLTTGTWVQASMLRLTLLERLRGLAQDVVICGHDRQDIGVMVFPLAADLQAGAVADGVLDHPALAARIAAELAAFNATVSGSAKRVARAVILGEAPSLEGQEVTDKGSLNPRKILTRRAAVLARLYAADGVILL